MARLQLLHACVRAVALGGELRDGRLRFLRGLALQLLRLVRGARRGIPPYFSSISPLYSPISPLYLPRLVPELGAPRRLRRAPCRLLGLELGLGLGLGLGVGLE